MGSGFTARIEDGVVCHEAQAAGVPSAIKAPIDPVEHGSMAGTASLDFKEDELPAAEEVVGPSFNETGCESSSFETNCESPSFEAFPSPEIPEAFQSPENSEVFPSPETPEAFPSPETSSGWPHYEDKKYGGLFGRRLKFLS